jgi:5'-nucleotidase
LDPALGKDVPLGNAKQATLLLASGLKIGFVGLGEREWLATVNALPPDLVYVSASQMTRSLVPGLRASGADLILAVSHQREPNDVKLAENVGSEMLDMVLGGHDHYYNHVVVNGVHVLRSGSDFKQLTYIEGWRMPEGERRWQFRITRRDVFSSIPEDEGALREVGKLTRALKAKLEKPIGYTLSPLDARFTTVRLKESNLGNFVCDLMRYYYNTDCCIMAGGTIRGDQIYGPGVLQMKDIMNW